MKHAVPNSPRAFEFLIDGKWHQPGNREIYTRYSPAHDVPVSQIPMCNAADVEDAVRAACLAFETGWADQSGAKRGDILLRAAALIRERSEEIAYWESLENGKPIGAARGEVMSCAGMFEFAAGHARALHGDSFNNMGTNEFGLVTREPIGVVGVITPWNFPFLILCERIPYILAAGCTAVIKPSEFTSATTLLLGQILQDAGLPDGVVNIVPGWGHEVGQAIADHKDIDMISFTGSTRTGRQLVQTAAQSFKKLGLELGGKNPQIVFADADLAAAAAGVAAGISYNTGQVCVSGSRLIVERSIAEQFVEMVRNELANKRIGDPLDEETEIGAITTEAQYQTITHYIEKGRASGAQLIWQGQVDQNRGQFIAPVIFNEVTADMEIVREEIFGPVLSVLCFDDIDEAINMANDTEYGLAASVWSKNIDRSMRVFRKVKAGRFWINTTLSGGPELPIGGMKQSGWGRDAGKYGVEEFTEIKSGHFVLGDGK